MFLQKSILHTLQFPSGRVCVTADFLLMSLPWTLTVIHITHHTAHHEPAQSVSDHRVTHTLCFFMKQQIFSHEVKVKSTLSECRAGKFLVSAPFLNPSVSHLHEGSFTNVTSAFEKALFVYSGAAVQSGDQISTLNKTRPDHCFQISTPAAQDVSQH